MLRLILTATIIGMIKLTTESDYPNSTGQNTETSEENGSKAYYSEYTEYS